MKPTSHAETLEDTLSAHMARVYRRWYRSDDYAGYLRSQANPHTLVRHVVRAKLAALYDAGPSAVARAEHHLRPGKGPNHSTIIHSERIAREVIADWRPGLVHRVERLIEETID